MKSESLGDQLRLNGVDVVRARMSVQTCPGNDISVKTYVQKRACNDAVRVVHIKSFVQSSPSQKLYIGALFRTTVRLILSIAATHA